MFRRTTQPDGLISVLLDKSAPANDRAEAAGDLGMYDAALPHLIETALDLNEEDEVVEPVGESIADIWLRIGGFDPAVVERMHPVARKELMLCMKLL
jgi:hypothetical protein